MKKHNGPDFDFGIYLVDRIHPTFPRMQRVVVLAVDMQAALSTVEGACKIERVDSKAVPIVINKAVLRMFKEKAGSK